VKNKTDKIFVNEVETLLREKPLRGNQTQEIHYPKTKQVTKHSHSQKEFISPSMNLSVFINLLIMLVIMANSSSLSESSSDETLLLEGHPLCFLDWG
jgi:hypothetical protein